ATIVLLIVFLLPLLARPHGSSRISCISNLKQVGLAARIYANDHEDRFPWMVSTNLNPTNTSGSMELTNSTQVFLHFKAMSNELNTPKILACFSDAGRSKTVDFTKLSNGNVSYLVGFDATESDP